MLGPSVVKEATDGEYHRQERCQRTDYGRLTSASPKRHLRLVSGDYLADQHVCYIFPAAPRHEYRRFMRVPTPVRLSWQTESTVLPGKA